MPHVLFSVINDVHTDNRVHRTASVFLERGYTVQVVGRTWPDDRPVEKPFAVHRFRCIWNKGPRFYLEFQIRLFRYLLRTPADLYLANDLDTLFPMALVAFLRQKPLIYDSHEYFCGVPELADRPLVRGAWKWIERVSMPFVTEAVTVSPPIARAYQKEYGIPFEVVRNVPRMAPEMEAAAPAADDRPFETFGRPDLPVILLQGAGINVDRGAEEAVEAMVHTPQAQLWIVGSGDVVPALKAKVQSLHLTDRVFFHDRVSAPVLRGFTQRASLGLSLDKPTNPNYRWSLPNKLFDAFQAGLPQVVSPVEEVARLVQTFEAGWVVPEVEPLALAHVFRHALDHPDERQRAREGALRAAQRYQWEVESTGWHRLIDRMEGKAPHVHVVSMDLPIPPLYGGMAEVKSQIEALLASGHSVELHAFMPTSKDQAALESWMGSHPVSDSITGPTLRLWTYRRGGVATALWSRLPYLIASRASVPLVRRLTLAPLPVLAHGYHSLWPALASRVLAQRTFLRIHNPERIYYRGLAEAENGPSFGSFWKRMYYRLEARRLARLEQKILPKLPLSRVWALTPGDAEATAPFFQTGVEVLPPAVPALLSCTSEQSENHLHARGIDRPFLLIHGKLSVAENDWAAHQFLDLWLAPSPEPLSPNYHLVIAGQGASGALRRRAADAAASGVVFVDSPEDLEMAVLLRGASVHGQLAVHRAGIKYKLLNALQTQAPIVGNEDLVAGTGAEGLVRLWTEPRTLAAGQKALAQALHTPLSAQEIEERARYISVHSAQALADNLALGLAGGWKAERKFPTEK